MSLLNPDPVGKILNVSALHITMPFILRQILFTTQCKVSVITIILCVLTEIDFILYLKFFSPASIGIIIIIIIIFTLTSFLMLKSTLHFLL